MASSASPSPPASADATFKLDDGLSFVHLSADESESEGSPLSKVKASREFQRDIEGRIDEGPVVTRLEQVGSYRMVGD